MKYLSLIFLACRHVSTGSTWSLILSTPFSPALGLHWFCFPFVVMVVRNTSCLESLNLSPLSNPCKSHLLAVYLSESLICKLRTPWVGLWCLPLQLMKIVASLPCSIGKDQSGLTEWVVVKTHMNVKVPLWLNLFGPNIKLEPGFSKCTSERATLVGYLLGLHESLSGCTFPVGERLSQPCTCYRVELWECAERRHSVAGGFLELFCSQTTPDGSASLIATKSISPGGWTTTWPLSRNKEERHYSPYICSAIFIINNLGF